MLKKSLGYGLLVCVLFFASLLFIPVTVSPSASLELEASPFYVQQVMSDINRFRDWDPRVISDSTVSYNFAMVNGKQGLEVTDTLDNVIANYSVEKSSIDEVNITVELKNINTFKYEFTLKPTSRGTKVTWDLELEVNLMIFLFSVEDRLEETFSKGLKSLSQILK